MTILKMCMPLCVMFEWITWRVCVNSVFILNQSIIYYTFIKCIQVSINLLDIAEIHNIHAISIHMSQWQRIHKYNMRNVHNQHKINTVISQFILPIKSRHTTRCTTVRGEKKIYSVCHLLCSGTTLFSRWVGTCLPLQHDLPWWMGEYGTQKR